MTALIESVAQMDDLSPAMLRRELMLAFGIPSLATVLSAARQCGEIMSHFLSRGAESHAVEWQAAVAEELLLHNARGSVISEDVVAKFATVPLAGNAGGPLFRDCLGNSAVAVFPLAGQDEPGIGHVWVVRGLPHRDIAQGVESTIPSGYSVCFTASHRGWRGTSWQLAGAMALAAVSEKPALLKQADLLGWVISGCIEGDRITKVAGLSSKGTLPLANKRWLLPRENAVDEDLKLMRRRLRMVYTESSLRSAIALVSGQGTRCHERNADRIFCDEMHAIIGGAPEPAIAGFLLSTADTLVLWHSKKSEKIAKLVAEVVQDLLHQAKIDLRFMPSGSVGQAESAIWRRVMAAADRRIVINVTGGNRLMSYAAHTMAKLFENIVLIYRDTDAPPHEFLEIVYQQDNPSEGKLACRPYRCADYRWDVLYANDSQCKRDASGILAEMRRGGNGK